MAVLHVGGYPLHSPAPAIVVCLWPYRVPGELSFDTDAIVGMQGGLGVDFHINLRDLCPVADCMLLGYTNGYFDYVPTILTATQAGYGAGNSNTNVLVGAGERLLDHA